MLQAELFSIEQLKRHAITLAGQYRIDPDPGADKLLPRLADNERVLLAAYDIVVAIPPGQRIVPAEAWLLDNFYLIEQQISMARRHLPRGYSQQLPRLAKGSSTGFPRIYDLSLELISHMDGRVDSENTAEFIAAYQSITPLKLGELWAFPIMLQLALLENLRRVALRIARRREERDAATRWADRMFATAEKEPKQLIQLLAEFANADVPLTAPFVEEFYSRLQALGPTMAFVQTWVEQKLIEQGVSATQLSASAARTAATNQISISNSIGSLRFIGTMDWRDYVESLSVVEQTLREDPAGIHASQDFATRDRYRHVIEDVARGSSCSELKVAREAIALAQTAAEKLGLNHRSAHIGNYLIDSGRPLLERTVYCRLSWWARTRRLSQRLRLSLYLSPVLLLSALGASVLLSPFSGIELSDWRYWFFSISGIIGVSVLAISVVNIIVTLLLPPRGLPRLDFSQGIPDIHRTMVVVPTLLSKVQEIDDLLEALEIRYLGNRDPNLFFALLTDFRDASEQIQPEDDELLAYARTAVQRLNQTYNDDRTNIFYLFHRPRIWNSHELVWMGYERKRGKLEQFNDLLRGGDSASSGAFSEIVGDVSMLSSIQYVITLDTDTQLPRDAARTLIGNIAHPLNRPVYDAARGRVVEGYAILQPRASISLTSAGQSRFSKLFAGESGIDPYTREVSDVYQDVFGEGSFIGKGIYDVDAFRQAIDGRFPDNLILSHDLLESGYARSALVTDVDLIEEHPDSYAIDVSRRHRWIRGDWQLAGWLLPSVPGPNGGDASRQRNPLSALSMWKIFDNLRRSLVSPALLALLLGGWLFGPGSVWFWSLSVVIVIFLPGALSSIIEFIRKPSERNWLVHLQQTGKATGHPLAHALLSLALLPYEALICLDAILDSGVRMLFTRRGLLLWHMSSYATRNARRTLPDFIMEMWIAPVLVLILTISLSDTELLFCAPILLLWLVSPAIVWWISLPLVSATSDLSAEQRLFLRTSARRTWRFFADFVGPEDNWLPPDNFQEYPEPVIASRTSPTNIGMSLLADLSAYDFGYISAGAFLQRIGNTLTTMEKLERYRGHFYNWYDTRTLQPLCPQYVSSVDSGNLIGSLLTLQAGLLELKDQPVLSANAFQGLRDTLQVLLEHVPSDSTADLSDKIGVLQEALIQAGSSQTLSEVDVLLNEIVRLGDELPACLPVDIDIDGELYYWVQAFGKQCCALRNDLDYQVPAGSQMFRNIPTLAELGRLKLAEKSADSNSVIGSSCKSALERLKIIDDLVNRCRELAQMDFEFLYDQVSGLLSIGYDVSERSRDPSFYDLLASEARLASFLLIAQQQLPQKHWF
ncbi:MAG: cyclic beta 1-2 glucan synthetase, partial [Gammaproteobacteria bacterium]|nr:cyclic beta 1-2 glucan synthetase [Gammaproteobacteria bacterium]